MAITLATDLVVRLNGWQGLFHCTTAAISCEARSDGPGSSSDVVADRLKTGDRLPARRTPVIGARSGWTEIRFACDRRSHHLTSPAFRPGAEPTHDISHVAKYLAGGYEGKYPLALTGIEKVSGQVPQVDQKHGIKEIEKLKKDGVDKALPSPDKKE